ncbi:hypothetical protein CMU25_17260 [Elizabethkingia anophelis]|nr:hypothetical protein [Elizabethkingia anophelis]MDV3842072.1 hypothetical protein [Elizabethkingia anophelis]
MNNKKTIISLLSLSLFFLMISCRSNDNVIETLSGSSDFRTGSAVINFTLSVNDYSVVSDEVSPIASIQNKNIKVMEKEQVHTFQIDDNKDLVATLTPLTSSLKTNSLASINPTAAITNLLVDVKFRIIVYNSVGTRIGTKTYTIKSTAGKAVADDNNDLYLDHTAGNYTFVALSYGNNTLPSDVIGDLNGASLSASGNDDLMYFQVNKALVRGDNALNIILKHLYSLITTKLDASLVASGQPINSITTATFSKHYQANNLKLSNGTITYGSEGTKPVDFSGNTGAVWTSKPTLIANSGTGPINIPSLTLNNLSVGTAGVANGIKIKTQTIDDISVKPGIKYNLNLNFRCTEVAPTNYSFYMADRYGTGPSPLSQTYTDFPKTSAGFTFDIYELDNSFQLNINGTNVAPREIQFEPKISGLRRNIRFKSDKQLWGIGGTTAPIYDMHGYNNSPSNPQAIFRITIAADGTVSMFGRRNFNTYGTISPLEPVELYQPSADTNAADTQAYAATAPTVPFNTVFWYSTGAKLNTVTVSLSVTGATELRGYGYGRNIVNPCP